MIFLGIAYEFGIFAINWIDNNTNSPIAINSPTSTNGNDERILSDPAGWVPRVEEDCSISRTSSLIRRMCLMSLESSGWVSTSGSDVKETGLKERVPMTIVEGDAEGDTEGDTEGIDDDGESDTEGDTDLSV